jgi:hypothetical protein
MGPGIGLLLDGSIFWPLLVCEVDSWGHRNEPYLDRPRLPCLQFEILSDYLEAVFADL